MNTIPRPSNRDRNADMKVLTKTVVKDLLSFSDRLTAHVAEHPDLLPGYVTSALGVEFRFDWASASEEECQAERAWATYCCDLFDNVQAFVDNAMGG